ncbi:PaaX family transcriptional regulator C-terminal domain-containing protein [Thalassovita sp.]|uniref:PaaX family transcriptional regulator C-terminal domain-containing protein n=1 Tax=Thalassovita sp. TaxID=1979401 RepID=UPI002B2711B2|nr:PaaX family transcriptional regulator C-terminal domain-containing protein [Thalassovita sp.]
MTAPFFQQNLDRLQRCGPLKVWSVVVTILGDFSETRDIQISGRVLGLLVGRMGITNQALRVALHRLRRDGWIEAERKGRTSNYFLTDQGWSMTQAVRPIIYTDEIDRSQPVHLAIAPPQMSVPEIADTLPEEAVALSGRAAVVAGQPDDLVPDWLITDFASSDLPEWVITALCPDDLQADYALLSKSVRALCLPPPNDLLDRTVLRLLALHHWRRLRLRHGPLPDLLLPPDWVGADARQAVLAVLNALPRPSLADLQAAYEQESSG